MASEINVVLVDDHEIFRDGIALLLNTNNAINLTGSVGSARKLFKLIENHPPVDVFILDINLPQMSGIEIARQLTRDYPKAKVIFLTSNTARMFMESALKTGAKGFLTKDCSTDELVKAIEKVFLGEYFFGSNIEQSVFASYVQRLGQTEDITELSDREIEVLRCFANGMSYNEIAEELSISKKTVEAHKKTIFTKCQFSNNADLVKYAIKHHIIEL
ncbi:MAG: response regulator transcription factor [Cyclobacteriaceae bacterium]